jgi:hypothetical protein
MKWRVMPAFCWLDRLSAGIGLSDMRIGEKEREFGNGP